MVFQRLIWKENDEDKQALYIKPLGNVREFKEYILFALNSEITTDTYFNAVSVGKWNTYTCLDMNLIRLTTEFEGEFDVDMINCVLENGSSVNRQVMHFNIKAPVKKTQTIMIKDCTEGIVYFRFRAKSEEAKLYGYECDSDAEKITPVELALNICTFKREKYLYGNLEKVSSDILNNPWSPLYGHLKVFVVDNGKTVDKSLFAKDSNILVFPNENVGGAGGFTRGLIEIMKYNRSLIRSGTKENSRNISPITHSIFMDDDIGLETEAIVRTYLFLTVLKKEYKKYFISGSMLKLNDPCIMYESGAKWNKGDCIFYNRGLDLKDMNSLLLNEVDNKPDYAAWWYCCIPFDIVNENNLPLPVFIHMDDVEYSHRNAEGIISMNGIGVWHISSEHNRLSSNGYYNMRNTFIVNALYEPDYTCAMAKRKVLSELIVALFRFRYKDMELIERAVRDFCTGPDYLWGLDAADNHMRILEAGYKMEPMGYSSHDVETVPPEERGIAAQFKKADGLSGKLSIIGKLLTINGWLLPANRKAIVYMNVHPIQLFGVKEAVLYDDVSEKGLTVSRDRKQLPAMVKTYFRCRKMLNDNFDKCCKEYHENSSRLRSMDYWIRVGKLDKDS
ncbi:MAG: hypothetical protein K6A23_03640 [Butyrivibrio sp.]|nr:hypothetical protein [Butyrivibrio sp.]